MSDLEWIRESNLIEGVDDASSDQDSLLAWYAFIAEPDLTWPIILMAHKGIMERSRPEIAGRQRNCNVRVGSYVCPPAKAVYGLICEWMRNYWRSLGHQDEKALRAQHIQFERIHPFEDGNGRVGRMVLNHQRIRAGFEPLLLKASERHSYYAWFKDDA